MNIHVVALDTGLPHQERSGGSDEALRAVLALPIRPDLPEVDHAPPEATYCEFARDGWPFTELAGQIWSRLSTEYSAWASPRGPGELLRRVGEAFRSVPGITLVAPLAIDGIDRWHAVVRFGNGPVVHVLSRDHPRP
jgi:hypothetical protein